MPPTPATEKDAKSTLLDIDQFRDRIDQTEAVCEICQFKAHSIIRHIKTVHGMSVAQYRNKFPKGRYYSVVLGELVRRMDRKSQSSNEFEDHLRNFPMVGEVKSVFASIAVKIKWPATLAEYIPAAIDAFEFEEQDKRIAWALARGKNVFAEGPTGCGKTESFFQVCNRLGVPVRRINMNGDVTVKNFIGSKEAGPNGTYFKEGLLPWCMENGVPIIVDEVDYTPPHIAAILHPVLEKGRRVYIPDAGRDYIAKEGFTVLATANTGGKGDSTGVYTGTEILNTAFLDRFSVKMKKTYLVEATEIRLLQATFPSEALKNIQNMVSFAGLIRSSFMQGKLALTLSTRKLIEYFEAKMDFDAQTALDMTVMDWLDGDDVSLVDGFAQRIQLVGAKKTK